MAVGRHCLNLSRKGRGNRLLVGMEDDIGDEKKFKSRTFSGNEFKKNFDKLEEVGMYFLCGKT